MAKKYMSPADTAKELRKALKEAFPGQVFSVRTHTYAGGASIRVRYVDGPGPQEVEDVARKFRGASFDGMTDMKSYHDSEHNGETVHWGADFVFVNREFSEKVVEQAEEFTRLAIEEDGGIAGPRWFGEVPQAFWRSANGEHLGFETNYWALLNVASRWIVEGRALAVKVGAR